MISSQVDELKKSGLDETAEFPFVSADGLHVIGGIPRCYVISSKLELDHLICPLCKNIIWKPVACGQNGCFSSFCQYCINNHEPSENVVVEQGEQPVRKCPKCIRVFKKTTIPLLNTILSGLVLKCLYSTSGCSEAINYEGFLKHVVACEHRRLECDGCKEWFLRRQLQQHRESCRYIMVTCEKCLMCLPKVEFSEKHSNISCLQKQLVVKNGIISQLESRVKTMKGRLDYFQLIMDKIIRGDNLPLSYEFHTSFPQNFQFNNNEVKLMKASWNSLKEKFDFLHFYITYPIKTDAFVGSEWKLSVKSLQGNLLIGVCSSLCTNSVDFVINKFGEIKKKEWNQNKYKLVRKSCLTFCEGDMLTFRYQARQKLLRIENETKNVECKLDSKEIAEIGQHLYTFYSLDTSGDTVRFL